MCLSTLASGLAHNILPNGHSYHCLVARCKYVYQHFHFVQNNNKDNNDNIIITIMIIIIIIIIIIITFKDTI